MLLQHPLKINLAKILQKDEFAEHLKYHFICEYIRFQEHIKIFLSSNFKLMAVLYCLEESHENCCIFFNVLVEWLKLNSFLVSFIRLGILPKKSMRWKKSETLTRYCLFLKVLKALSLLQPDVTFLETTLSLWLYKKLVLEKRILTVILSVEKKIPEVFSRYS